MQLSLLSDLRQPLVGANGVGVDSMGYVVGLRKRGIRPDLMLHADVGGEKDETEAYIPIMNEYMWKHWKLELTIVRYVPKDFKHWPPYYTLEENCLTNGTLPSISFSFQFKSCSQKWKAAPQHKFLKNWPMAKEWWAAGGRVKKIIGYDASPADEKRSTYACDPNKVKDDNLYEYWYPLQEWGWDRARCIAEIEGEGIPAPPKSSCIFCAAMQPWEVEALPKKELRRIVRLEARARPRFKTAAMKGLWGRDTKKRPGSMTQFILERGLLPVEEVEWIIENTPTELIAYQEAYARGEKVPPFGRFMKDQLVQIETKKGEAAA